ncbi:MAG: alpha-keto acid decarboxylase family protein [Planctomycetes bacterium]|nr:alpha-keto acid decarboxylase family protein [Planctomycetota bacterium]
MARARNTVPKRPTIAQYLIKRLHDYGVRHVFGIPGDYILTFYDRLSASPLKLVGTSKEDGAGFAADAYARVKGMGAVCVTYCVGGLSIVNAVAGAYAEKSPVVVISGAPGMDERVNDPLLHHKVRTFSSQREIFEKITAAAVALEDPETAFSLIDETLATCWRLKRPVYFELPRDLVDAVPRGDYRRQVPAEVSDPAILSEAVTEAVARLNAAKRPVILADVEMHRFGLSDELVALVERTGYPVAATILGKSVIGELHPSYLGVYEGAMGRAEVQRAVEDADCLLMLGTVLSDVNLGVFTARLDPARAIEATSEKVRISRHRYDGIRLGDFVGALLDAPLKRRPKPKARPRAKPAPLAPAQKIRATRLFELLDQRLEEDMAVVCDVGLCLFGAIDLTIHRRTEFIAPAYYTSMGFGVPASVGAALANPALRPVVLVGDGAFQMTGMELSTIAAQKLDPIVILLDNRGYTTERFINDGPYNDIHPWHYEKMADLLGVGTGCVVGSEGEFAAAWDRALGNRGQFSLIVVNLDPLDPCPALKRLGEQMGANCKPR